MKSYIESLRRQVEQADKERELVKEAATPPTVKSLDQQLTEYLRTLSKEQLSTPFTMNEIILAGDLKGKYRNSPHPQQVAEILTRNGWTKRRLYGEYGGKRYWFAND
jgi:hypothetical protein